LINEKQILNEICKMLTALPLATAKLVANTPVKSKIPAILAGNLCEEFFIFRLATCEVLKLLASA